MNSLYTIFPYCQCGIWFFDDKSTGLVSEPLVGDTNRVVDQMILNKGLDLEQSFNGIILTFGVKCPDSQIKLELLETDRGGSTYEVKEYGLKPWLCPAFFKYFAEAPKEFYGGVVGYARKHTRIE